MQGAIHRLRDGPELVCRVQTDLGVDTPYLLCAPVQRRDDWGALVPRLHIPCQVGGEAHVIVMSQMVALPAGVLGPEIANAVAERDRIVAAVDLLVSGF
ncbi:CcdB family protein [Marinibacterium sp. SX1]|uniref:CcdB family protein n=1 Tax=Marinibacterium sp. SX1 TaxID=3388424 RepID=UPI003D170389